MSNADFLISRSDVDDEWKDILGDALEAVDADYLSQLIKSDGWLPGIDNLFSAFRRDRLGVRYVLIGESPYPRAQSANGIAFYDGAVAELWSETGLSKSVNRATSLRNIIKTALLAEGYIERDPQGKISQASIATIDKSGMVQTMADLFPPGSFGESNNNPGAMGKNRRVNRTTGGRQWLPETGLRTPL
jgi:uracil-DNA glycosylase